MRPNPWLLVALSFGLPIAAGGQTPDTVGDSTARRIADLTRELEALRREVRQLAEMGGAPPAPRQAPDQRFRRPSGIASRPFVFGGEGGAAVGGYVDLEFIRDYAAATTTFTHHRLIPFVFAEISDRLHFGTEIELEYGGPQSPTRDGEIKVEFAALDLSLTSAFNVRAGAVLAPLGKFNLIHDSPVNDLTDRPLVAGRIIPTTFTEAGAGIWGQVFPSEASVLTYEAYVVNGFNDGVISYAVNRDSSIAGTTNLRNARGSLRRDNNEAKSLVGRVAFSPALGMEIGLSAHHGRVGSADSETRLTVGAVDAIVARGRWEVLGEVAVASLDLDPAAERARARLAYQQTVGDTTGFGAAYDRFRAATLQRGAYVQLNYHFLQGAFAAFPNSTFTGIARFDHLDLDAGRTGALQQRLSVGVNWRAIEQTALKLDYQWNWETPAGSATARSPANRLVASVATYF